MRYSAPSKVNTAPSKVSAITSERNSAAAIHDQGHQHFGETFSETEKWDLGGETISISTQSQLASHFGHQLAPASPRRQTVPTSGRKAVQLKPLWDGWKLELGVGPVEAPKIEGPASEHFRSHPDLGIPSMLLGKGLGMRFSNKGFEPIAIDGLGGKGAWESYSMSDAREKINGIGGPKKDSEIDRKSLDSLTQEISRSARQQMPSLPSLPMSLGNSMSGYQLEQGDLRPNLFSPPSLFAPDELQLMPPSLLSGNETPEKKKRTQRKQVKDELTQPKLLENSSNSLTVIQPKSNYSAPIQRQGYGYEDEEQMMSVWNEDLVGMSTPDGPVGVPVYSNPPKSQETVSKPNSTKDKYKTIIRNAEHHKLPTNFLREVSSSYTFGSLSQENDYVKPYLNYMNLTQDTLHDALSGSGEEIPREPVNGAAGIGTIYHESTHAYLDLMEDDPEFENFIERGEAYYKDAPLRDGTFANDPERVFQEAAASYVGTRVSNWWSAYEMLSILAEKKKSRNISDKEIDIRSRTIDRILEDYNNTASDSYGYQEKGGFLGYGSHQVETDRKMSPGMVKFLEEKFLEGKIPRNFEDEVIFRNLIGEAMSCE